MEHICAFLRGVNVNGVKMKMDNLKKVFAAMSYPGAQTILATGNVIIPTDRDDLAALKTEIEKGLSAAFHYDAYVFLRTAKELASVMSAAARAAAGPDCHLYWLICDDSHVITELSGVFASLPHQQNETFIPTVGGAFWIVPVGETLESAFGSKVLGAKKYKDKLTSRNMNTIEKITKLMNA